MCLMKKTITDHGSTIKRKKEYGASSQRRAETRKGKQQGNKGNITALSSRLASLYLVKPNFCHIPFPPLRAWTIDAEAFGVCLCLSVSLFLSVSVFLSFCESVTSAAFNTNITFYRLNGIRTSIGHVFMLVQEHCFAFLHLSLSVCLPVYLFVSWYVYLSVCSADSPSVCWFVCLTIFFCFGVLFVLFVYLSSNSLAPLSVCLSDRLCVCKLILLRL